jgi:hypothetical protein
MNEDITVMEVSYEELELYVKALRFYKNSINILRHPIKYVSLIILIVRLERKKCKMR